MTVDTKGLREQMSDWRKFPPTDRHPSYILDDIAPEVVALIDENERLKALARDIHGIAWAAGRHEIEQQLAAMTAARDELAGLAESLSSYVVKFPAEGGPTMVDRRIAELRKVGTP